MKKIAIFLSMIPEEGGKFQYSLSIIEGLSSSICEDLYDVSAVFYDDDWRTYIPDNIYKVKVNTIGFMGKIVGKIIVGLPCGLCLWRLLGRYFHPVHKCLYKLKPDVVFYPGNDPFVYNVGLPGIIPIFDLMHRYEFGFTEISDDKIYKKRESHYTKVCKYAKAILVDSEVGKQHVLECYKVKKDKINILPYIAPPYVRGVYKKVDVAKKYNLPDKFIFYPAQFWSHKNHSGLIKAIALLKEDKLLINAVFVGSPKNSYHKIRHLIDKLEVKEQIYILDYVSNADLVSLYRKAVALVMPTFCGPTNIPQLEAFALGCPVLTSGIYAIPDQVGDAALLFDPKHVNEIAEKIKMIWNNENIRKKLIKKGYEKDSEWTQRHFNDRLLSIIG